MTGEGGEDLILMKQLNGEVFSDDRIFSFVLRIEFALLVRYVK